MKITYDVERLKSIVDDICELTQVSISIVDTRYNHIYCCEKGDDSYCHLIQSSTVGKHKCHHSDGEMLRRCGAEKQPISHLCHAGVLDTALPIMKQGQIVGYILLGRVRPQEEPQDPAERLDWAADSAAIAARYKKLTCLTQTQLDSLIHLLSHDLFQNAITVEYDTYVQQAAEYIDDHLTEELTVERLCRTLYVSKNALYRGFRELYGCTVNNYVTHRRIEKAKELLICSEDGIAHVAQAVGFYNYTYFSRLFRERTGLSPRDYRSQVRAKK